MLSTQEHTFQAYIKLMVQWRQQYFLSEIDHCPDAKQTESKIVRCAEEPRTWKMVVRFPSEKVRTWVAETVCISVEKPLKGSIEKNDAILSIVGSTIFRLIDG